MMALTPLPLMELSSGLFASKTLAAAVELGLFEALDLRPRDAQETADQLGLPLRPAKMLLGGCTALGLVVQQDGRFANSAMADTYLVPGRRWYFGDYIAMLDRRVYAGWMRLAEALRTDRPTTWDPREKPSLFDPDDPAMLRGFWRAMHSLSVYTASVLAQGYDFSGIRRLLDVGGGGGAFTIELCRAHPHLTATIFDLPFVCEQTEQRVAEAGLSDRITCVAGDFFADVALPGGHDAALLSSVLHDWSPAENQVILDKVVAALPVGGQVLISELLMDDDETGPAPAALFNLLMLVETARGGNYSGAAYSEWLRAAGCVTVARIPLDGVSANAVLAGIKG